LSESNPNKATSANTITIQSGHIWDNSSSVTIPGGDPQGLTIIHNGITGVFNTSNTIRMGFFSTYIHNSIGGEATVINGMSNINAPSTIVFAFHYPADSPGTIPSAAYGNLIIPEGAHYQYVESKSISTSWGTKLIVDGVLSLKQSNASFGIGSGPSDFARVSELLGSGVINGPEKLKLGTLANQRPININFTGKLFGIVVTAPINLFADLKMDNQCYFVLQSPVDLNGYTLEARSLNGPVENILFKNSWAGNLTIKSDALGLASLDNMPFNNITLNGSTTISSNLTVNGTLTNSGNLNLGSYQITLPNTSSLVNTGTINPEDGIHYIVNSINENPELSIKVFPSVTSDILNVVLNNNELAGNTRVEIIDLTGKLCKKSVHYRDSNVLNISVGDLSNGVYILKISNVKNIAEFKFVKH
jgi:hypothetical protein